MLRVILTVGLTQTNLSISASAIAYRAWCSVRTFIHGKFNLGARFAVFRYGESMSISAKIIRLQCGVIRTYIGLGA